MSGFVTCCFSDWQAEQFQGGVMKIRNGKKTGEPIRRLLVPQEIEGVDYYLKPDPNFSEYTYSVCHRKLREVIDVGDHLFFRTLWRGHQYLIGYFQITRKTNSVSGPILHSDVDHACLIDFSLLVTEEIARAINPRINLLGERHLNQIINGYLGRNFKRIKAEEAQALCRMIHTKLNNLDP